MVELGLKKTIGLLECFDLKSLSGTNLFDGFDALRKANIEPSTRLVILYLKKNQSLSYQGRICAPRRSMPSNKSWSASGASDNADALFLDAAGHEKVPF